MRRQYLMALDAGGGSGRCLLLDPDTGDTFSATRQWSHPQAANTASLGYNMDLPKIWSRLGEATREALARCGAGPGDIAGISVTSMRNTTVIMDDHDTTVFTASNQDARALAEAMGLGASWGRDIHSTGGHWPSPLFTGARLLWLKNNAPAVLQRARVVFSLSDWLAFRLGAKTFAEKSQSAETLLYDLEWDDWSFRLIEDLGLSGEVFPPTVDAGTQIGTLSEQAASHFGIASGIPIAAGGADTQCGLLGAGACEPADLGVIAGTTMPVQLVTSKMTLDREGRLWSGRHVIPGLFVLESNGLTTGSVLEWLARILFTGYQEPVMALMAEAADSEPGAAGVFSTLGACVFDGRTIGIPMGSLSMSHMVTPDAGTARRHIGRAVIEGIAYSALANSAQIYTATQTEPCRVFITGGMSRSRLWTQILCDAYGREILVSASPEASSLGAAICAGMGAGVYPDLITGSRERLKGVARLSPGASSDKYQALYTGWKADLDLREAADNHLAGLMTISMLERSQASGATPDPSFKPSILVTASLDDASLDELNDLGEVTYAPWRENQVVFDGGKALIEALDHFRVFITEMDIVDFDAIKALPELKAVISCRVNPVNVDLSAATAYAIPVINTPGRNAGAVADLALAYMIMLSRNLEEAADFLKLPGGKAGDMARMGQAYLKFQGGELWRKTVGIIGLGEVGRRLAERAISCGAKVVFSDPGVTEETGAKANARKVSLRDLLTGSDFITIHAPSLPSTEGMLGRDEFASMKPGAFFINTARASLVDSKALREALDSGRLAGAALDVFPDEPPASEDPVASHPHVIATPHLGGNTFEVAAHQGSIAAGQLRKLLRGEKPDYILNPEVLEVFDWTSPRPEPDAVELDRLARNPRPSMTS